MVDPFLKVHCEHLDWWKVYDCVLLELMVWLLEEVRREIWCVLCLDLVLHAVVDAFLVWCLDWPVA